MPKIILTLFAALCVNAAAHAGPNLQITPVNFTQKSLVQVNERGYDSYWFGRVPVNSRNVARYTVTNTGDAPLEYLSSYMSGLDFRAYHNCDRTLLPQQRCSVEIVYWPAFEGYHSGDFYLDFKQDSLQIHVWGEAYRF